MAGIVERLGSMAGTEAGKAVNLAHQTFQARMGEHSHFGRALLETVAEVARAHPNLMGIAAGLMIEQLLVEERRRHEVYVAGVADGSIPPHEGLHLPHLTLPHVDMPHADMPHINAPHLEAPHLHLPHLPTHAIRLSAIRPGHVAMEVFGALVLLKFASAGARMFRRKNKPEIWFAPAAKIHLFSGTLAAYYGAKSLKSPKVSAWRNAAVALFATDALKPLLKAPKRAQGAAANRTASSQLGLGPALVSPAPTPPSPPASGPPTGPTSTASPFRDTSPAAPETPTPGANDTHDHDVSIAPAAAVASGAALAVTPQFWTPSRDPGPAPAVHAEPVPDLSPHHAPASSEGLRGEIIQWTGFSASDAASSRLID